jgi:hypothetical protein
MNDQTRRVIAYVAGRRATGYSSASVYDYGTGTFTNLSGTVSGQTVSVYDYDRGCHVSGSTDSLYDYGNGAHLTLRNSGESFSGYDYATGNHFSGSVSGRSVWLFDYQTGSHYSFSI